MLKVSHAEADANPRKRPCVRDAIAAYSQALADLEATLERYEPFERTPRYRASDIQSSIEALHHRLEKRRRKLISTAPKNAQELVIYIEALFTRGRVTFADCTPELEEIDIFIRALRKYAVRVGR